MDKGKEICVFPSPYLGMSLPDSRGNAGLLVFVSVPIPGDVPNGLSTFADGSGAELFPSPYLGMSLPDICGNTKWKVPKVSVPISGDVPSGHTPVNKRMWYVFPSPYLGMSLPDDFLAKDYTERYLFPSPYLGMSLPDSTLSIILKNI